jgi:hypothetical protein
MANYTVISGEINSGVLYYVDGTQSISYNAATYNTGQFFRGVAGVRTFTYAGTGTKSAKEVFELNGGAIELIETTVDQPVYPELTKLTGMAIEMMQTDGEKIFNETTVIKGFTVELIDYPIFSISIHETRL